MGKYFGTDGIRGVANSELTISLSTKVALALGEILKRDYGKKVLIGRDTRISGTMIESALVAGLNAMGIDCEILGALPTPAVAYLVKLYKADAGIMISASHNPYEFNGIKIFNSEGFKLSDEKEDEIEKIIDDKKYRFRLASKDEIGISYINTKSICDYVNHIKECVDFNFKGFKVVVDCANGSASATAKKLFDKLKIDAHIICSEPNGININDLCGSTHLARLTDEVVKKGAKLGIAFDGDADRCLCVDEEGNVIDGDKMIAVFSKYLKDEDKLKNNSVAVTKLSNLGFFKFCEENDIKAEITDVGDRYVLERMLEKDILIGGEQSGHIILKDYATTGDGQLSAVMFLKALIVSGKKASELTSIMYRYPQVMINMNVENSKKYNFDKDEEILKSIEKAEKELEGDGRIIVRASGTEPLVRVMIEGKDYERINEMAQEIADVIKERLS